MNIPIKVRAWQSVMRTMTYSDSYESLEAFFGRNYENNVYTTMLQFIGLFDSNGKDIYVGDVVTYTSRYRGDVMNCVVVFDSRQGQYKFSPISMYKANAGNGGWTGFDYKMASRTEIIGNIYENPALLEE